MGVYPRRIVATHIYTDVDVLYGGQRLMPCMIVAFIYLFIYLFSVMHLWFICKRAQHTPWLYMLYVPCRPCLTRERLVRFARSVRLV